MSLTRTREKIQTDLEAGREFKAVKRLRSLIKTYPHDLSLRHQLATIYDEAGFQDAAGLHWLLCEPKNARMRQSVAIYRASVNHSSKQILADLAFYGDIAELDGYAQSVLQQLQTEATGQLAMKVKKDNSTRESAWGEKGCLVVMLVLLTLFLVGVINGLMTIFPWLTDKML